MYPLTVEFVGNRRNRKGVMEALVGVQNETAIGRMIDDPAARKRLIFVLEDGFLQLTDLRRVPLAASAIWPRRRNGSGVGAEVAIDFGFG